MHNLEVIGRIGTDAEVKKFPDSGRHVVNWRLAVNRRWKDKNGEVQERTTWYDCAYWKGTEYPAVATHLKAGTLVSIRSDKEPQVDVWADKETGEIKHRIKLDVARVAFLAGSQKTSKPVSVSPPKEQKPQEEPVTADESDVPF